MQVERDQIKTLLILVGIVAAFVLGVWLPLNSKRKRVEASMAELQQTMQGDRTMAVGLAAMGAQINALQIAVDRSDKIVPNQNELASLLRDWSTELDAQQVEGQDIDPQEMYVGQDYTLIPIKLKFHGSFMAAFRFLRHVESMNRLIRFGSIQMNGNPDEAEEPLIVRVELSTFFMPDEVAEVQP